LPKRLSRPACQLAFFFQPVLFGLVLSAGPSTWVERADVHQILALEEMSTTTTVVQRHA
jgi:hypothetical protein